MECQDIQQKLSAYVEGIVPQEGKILIEAHLKSCPKCYKSLVSLRKTIDYVHSLEDLEPPAWLTQKVMAKIKAEVQPKKGIIQKLFYPLHIKLPLEAVVTVLIAAITIYVFKTIQPEIKLAQAPSEHETVIARSPSRVGEEATSQEKIASPLTRNYREKLLPPTSSLEKSIPPPSYVEKSTPSSPSLGKRGKEGFEVEQPVPAKEPMVMDKLQEAPQPPPPMQKQDEVRPSAGVAAKEETRFEVLSRTGRAKVSDEKTEAVNVTVFVKDIKIAKEEIETTLTHLGGKTIKAESFENKEIVNAEINSQKYKEFIARLKSTGDVKEKGMDLKASEDHIEIAVEIINKPLR